MTPRAPASLRLPALLIAAALLAVLSGCGKKANLEPPPGEVSHFPRVYPYGAGQVRTAQPKQRQQEPRPETAGEEPPNSLILQQPGLPQSTSPLTSEP